VKREGCASSKPGKTTQTQTPVKGRGGCYPAPQWKLCSARIWHAELHTGVSIGCDLTELVCNHSFLILVNKWPFWLLNRKYLRSLSLVLTLSTIYQQNLIDSFFFLGSGIGV
jgi:hypothetical protein